MGDNYTKDLCFNIPVIPLRGLVIFPEMVLHFDVGRSKSIAALKSAMNNDQKVFLVCQKDASVDDPDIDDIYDIGVVCNIKQMLKIPNSNNLRVVVEGEERAALNSLRIVSEDGTYLSADISYINCDEYTQTEQIKAYQRAVKSEFEAYASLVPKINESVIAKVISISHAGKLCDYICSNTFLDCAQKQDILETCDVQSRLTQLLVYLKKENTSLEIEAEIHEKVQIEIDKNQREYYLREEMKVIADTLGEGDNPLEEAEEYKGRVNGLKCSVDIKDKLLKECDKLMKMPSGSHEATVVRNYLDKCLEIPFGKYTNDRISLERARKILDRDHYGIDNVKQRVVDSLAVYKRNPEFNGQILCFAGPPGVGKTSVVKSLANAMGRKYVRVALGGIHDEAEIRGHRKTYIGSMPGRIVDAVIKSGVMNPIILLDEIDKLGNDYKGDPSSALLEALDPEQNSSFVDHYIDFSIDLSRVMFITTANDTSRIDAPLYDRMEVIELNSYSPLEKLNPIILLDEIDKLGNDYKGDPSSALLEALDPEQNSSFVDHYIDFSIDLSRVMFITTANDTSRIDAPLYDRMEVIELNSYSPLEKLNIAKKHLVKKELARHSLSARELKITDDALSIIIDCYTREAGVRQLQKEIATLCRKSLVEIEKGKKSVKITADNIEHYLGKKKYLEEAISKDNLVGTVNGLAWTSVGGTMLPIEVSALDGTGKIELTGNLGDVMKESAKTAVSYVRSIADNLGINTDFYKTKDIHIHAPEAAIPKDGPSAGLALTTAIVSELTGVAIKSNVAMTGEISLKGKALPIGGLKEKSMAAYKAGCDTVIIPRDNEKDLADISEEVKATVSFVTVSSFEELVPYAFVDSFSYADDNKKKQKVVMNKKSTTVPAVTQ